MANLDYKLEYFKSDSNSDGDEGAYIHFRTDMPAYQSKIGKEEYYCLPEEKQSEFLNTLFSVGGVEVISSMAFRLYIEKSPVFSWSEVLGPLIEVVRVFTSMSGVNELPGSPVTLTTANRRGTEFNC
jgi:hypothetical protein